MISCKEYRKRTLAQWKKVKVETIVPLRNGYMEIPVGTVCSITDKHGGFTLKTDACPTCGIHVFIRKVTPAHVRIIEVAEDE